MKKYTDSHAIIFDDHIMFAEALALVLERLEYFSAVSIVRDEPDLRSQLLQNTGNPVLLFLDYYLPDCHVISLMADIRKLYNNVKTVIISSVIHPVIIGNIYAQHPAAIISKAARIAEIVACLSAIEKKQFFISGFIKAIIENKEDQAEVPSFTMKEFQILSCLNMGKNTRQISEQLNISIYTVTAHKRNMMNKTNSHSVTELLNYCREIGLDFTGH